MSNLDRPSEPPVFVDLGQNYRAIVDADIWNERLSGFRWLAQIHRRNGEVNSVYAYASIHGTSVTMHRFIMRAGKGKVVDHRNHDTLDNRMDNLRFVTHGQNRANSRANRTVASGHKGVAWSPTSRKWIAIITVAGKRHYLGLYAHKERAAMAVDRAALRFHGEFACLNFEELREVYRFRREPKLRAAKRQKVYCVAEAFQAWAHKPTEVQTPTSSDA